MSLGKLTNKNLIAGTDKCSAAMELKASGTELTVSHPTTHDYIAATDHRVMMVFYENGVEISDISKASEGIVTTSSAHGLSPGDRVGLVNIRGMREIKGQSATVLSPVTSTTFAIDIDTTNYEDYSSPLGNIATVLTTNGTHYGTKITGTPQEDLRPDFPNSWYVPWRRSILQGVSIPADAVYIEVRQSWTARGKQSSSPFETNNVYSQKAVLNKGPFIIPYIDPLMPSSEWYIGNGAPSNDLGINGDNYLDESNGEYYQKSDGVWVKQNGNLSGPAGYSTVVLNAYKRSAASPGDNPGAIDYTFSTNTVDSPGYGNGWTRNIPAVDGNPLWVRQATASSQTDTDNIGAGEWSGAVELLNDGADGTDGLNNATIYIYQRTPTSTAPGSLPSASVTYNFSTGQLDSPGPDNGWSQTLPVGGDPYLWISLATASNTASTDTITSGEWATAELLSVDGADGATGATGPSGYNNKILHAYQRSVSDPGTNPGSVTYNFSTDSYDSPGLGNSWLEDIPAADGNPLWVVSASASSQTDSDSIGAGEWTSSVKLVEDGSDGSNGTDGLNNATVYLYQRTPTSTAPNVTTQDSVYTFSSGLLSTPLPDNGWSQTLPTAGDPYLWMILATASNTTATDVIDDTEWSTPELLSVDGADGAAGAAGLNSATVYIYKRTTTSSTPALPTTSSATYTFADGTLDALNNGWTRTIPAKSTDEDYLWTSFATASATTATDEIADTEWETAQLLGEMGLNTSTVSLYHKNTSDSTPPSTFTGTFTYTFSTAALSGGTLNGWSQSAPDIAAGEFLWIRQATAVSSEATDSITAGTFSAGVVVGVGGSDGAAGAAGVDALAINYTNNSHSVPVDNLGAETWTGSGGNLYVFEGDTLLTLDQNAQSTGYPTTPGEYRLDITKISGDTLTEPGITGQTTTTSTLAAWAGNLTTATVYRVTAYVYTLNSVQVSIPTDVTLSPSFEGDDGATGSTGAQGDAGVDAIAINYTNNSHSVPVDNLGAETWTGSGGKLYIYEGNTLLTLDQNAQSAAYPTTPGEYRLNITKITGDTLTEPGITGQTTTEATLADWAGNLTTVTVYKIDAYVYTSGSIQVLISTYVTLAPSLEGATGDQGYALTVTADKLVWVYDKDGLNPDSPTTATVTATAYGFTSPEYRFDPADGGGFDTWSATNTATYTAEDDNADMPEIVLVEAREGASGTADITGSLAMIGVQTGATGSTGGTGATGAKGLRTIQGYLYMEKATTPATPPAAPSNADDAYTFSTGIITGTDINTGASTTDVWENAPRVQDATTDNKFYTCRYYGTESAADSSTIDVLSYSNVVEHTEFSGVVRFINGTEIADGTTTYDPAADVNLNATTIDGGKITTGTLNADRIVSNSIKTLQIDANQITATEIAGNTITANEIQGGTITADELNSALTYTGNLTIGTAGKIVLSSTSELYTTGKTAYNVDTDGIWMGWDTTTAPTSQYKVYIGNATNWLKWDSSTVSIKGDITVTAGSVTASILKTGTSLEAPRAELSHDLTPIEVLSSTTILKTGTHTGSNGAATLTDSGAAFGTDTYNDAYIVKNVTDGSWAEITDTTGTTIVGALQGGTDNDWDTGDTYEVREVENVLSVDTTTGKLIIAGDFESNSLDTAAAYTAAGITDLRNRLGFSAPASPTGGTVNLSSTPYVTFTSFVYHTPITQTGDTTATWHPDTAGVGTLHSGGPTGTDITLKCRLFGNEGYSNETSNQNWVSPVYDIWFEYIKEEGNGTDDTSSGAAFLTDSTATWANDEWIGSRIYNVTDGSDGLITDNDGTTVTATMSSGTWDSGDEYIIYTPVYHDTGTHTPAGSSATVLTDSTKDWTDDEWIGYYVVNVSDDYSYGVITDNTGTTLTVASLEGGTQNDFDQNEVYFIVKGTRLTGTSSNIYDENVWYGNRKIAATATVTWDGSEGTSSVPVDYVFRARVQLQDNVNPANTKITILEASEGVFGDADAFTGLSDTPSTYAGAGTYFVKVNSGATALEFVDDADYALLASPVFTGNPTAPTPSTADNDTSIATTAFVKDQNYLTGNQSITLSGDLSGSGTTSISATIATDAVDIAMLSATGTPDSSTFLRGDNVWAAPGGGGDVSKVATPVNDQVGVWTGDGTIEGDTELTFDGTNLTVGGKIITGTLSGQSTTTPDTVGDSSGFTVNYMASGASPKPAGTDHSLLTMSYNNLYQTQIAADWRNSGRLFIRGQDNGTWSGWERVWSTEDAPVPTTGTSNFLRQDGTWAVPDADASNHIKVHDTRAADDAPNHFDTSVWFDFKTRTTFTPDAPGNDTYTGVMTIAPWVDASGGPNYQLVFSNTSDIPLVALRLGDHGTGGSDWGSWYRLSRLEADETVTGDWNFTDANTPPASGSKLSTDMLYLDGKEAIDGNDTWLRLNQNDEFDNGVYTPYAFRADGHIVCQSDGKYLYMGVSTDLQIGHNGTDSVIYNTTGDLLIKSSQVTTGDVVLQVNETTNGTTTVISAISGAADSSYAELREGGDVKLITTTDGITVSNTGGSLFKTQDRTATGATSGAQVRAHNNDLRDIGFNVVTRQSTNSDVTLSAEHAGSYIMFTSANTTNKDITTEANNTQDFPNGSRVDIINSGSTGTITVKPGGTGGTLAAIKWFDGASVQTGNRVIGVGGWATLHRYDGTDHFLVGVGIS